MREQLPEFVRDLSDRHLERLTDPTSLKRARAYVSRVLDLDDAGTSLVGDVVGNGRLYQTSIAIEEREYVYDECTCPIGGGCKHVAALVLRARADAAASGPSRVPARAATPNPPAAAAPPASPPAVATAAWEVLLEEILPAASTPGSVRRLALVLTVETSRYDDSVEVSIEPRCEGARGDWVKSGARWSEITAPYRSYDNRGRGFDPAQVEALRALAEACRDDRYAYYTGYRSNEAVRLSDGGAAAFDVLERAVAAGVPLLGQGRGSPPRLLDTRAGVVATITPPDGDRPGALEAALVAPDLPGVTQDDWRPILAEGHEVIGWAALEPGTEEWPLLGATRPVTGQQVGLVQAGRVEIPAADWPRFVLGRLPALRRVVAVSAPDDLRAAPPTLLLRVRHHEGHRSSVRCFFAYGLAGGDPDQVLEVPVAPGVESVRDHEAERALLDRLLPRLTLPSLWARGGTLAEGAEFVGLGVADLVEQLDALADDPDVRVVVDGEAAPYGEAVEAPTIAISATGSGEDDWFDLLVTVSVAGEQVPLADLIEALTLGHERMLLDSGAWFRLDRPELHRLASSVAEARMLQDREGGPLRLTPLHAGLWEELVQIGVVAEQSVAWQERVAVLTDVAARDHIDPPGGLAATLRDYQVDGFRWLATLWDAQLGGVLADDMGLGKTVQVLAAIQRAHEAGDLADPVLIVAPTSVLATWEREAARFCPGLGVAVVAETRRKAGVVLADTIAGADLVVTSYALLRLDAEEFQARKWSALVLDEAQFVKNFRSKGYSAARQVPARRTFALTGTPLENSLMDLWSMLSLTAPGLYPRPEKFREHYAIPIEKQGAVAELAGLRRRIRPLMLRRTKEQVVAELPPKQESVVPVPQAPRHQQIYQRHLQRERQRILGLLDDLDTNRFRVLQALTELRQLALDPSLVEAKYAGVATSAKIDVLVEHLHELAAEGHRALVFSQFTGFLRLVRERLRAEGIEHSYLDGRTRSRETVVDGFRHGAQVAFLISLKAGGFGLNLTEADYVYVLDPWWNPAAEMQAVDRTHRIGQTKPVNVYRLVSADTIEEKVVALQDRKRDLFARVVEDDATFASALSATDLRELLQG